MQVSKVRLTHDQPSQKGFRCICKFNLELAGEIVLYDLQYVEAPDGKAVIIPPKAGNNSPMCSISPKYRDMIAELVKQAMLPAMAQESMNWFKQNVR